MNVLLLRQEEDENDKYHQRFEDQRINTVKSIPVLSFEYCNRNQVKAFAENTLHYSGLIFTSRRAVTAFEQVVTEDQLLAIKANENFSVYVVGRTTENALQQLQLISKGADTGNAKELSELIISQELDADKPLMFLCGNLARETIPKRLTENGIPNESISCYKTVPNESFKTNLKQYLEEQVPDVIVFFSPSGAEFYLETIKELIPDFKTTVNIVCIGDYTAQCVEKLDVDIAGVAAKPTPDGLFDVVKDL